MCEAFKQKWNRKLTKMRLTALQAKNANWNAFCNIKRKGNCYEIQKKKNWNTSNQMDKKEL